MAERRPSHETSLTGSEAVTFLRSFLHKRHVAAGHEQPPRHLPKLADLVGTDYERHHYGALFVHAILEHDYRLAHDLSLDQPVPPHVNHAAQGEAIFAQWQARSAGEQTPTTSTVTEAHLRVGEMLVIGLAEIDSEAQYIARDAVESLRSGFVQPAQNVA